MLYEVITLPQSGIVHSGRALMDEIDTAFAYGRELYDRLEALGDELARSPAEDSKTLRLVEEHHRITSYNVCYTKLLRILCLIGSNGW